MRPAATDRATIRPGHVAIYIRWSTEDQSEGTTLAVQRQACHHFLLSQGWQYRDELVFVDEGYSGGSLDRPALHRLREQVQACAIDCVVVYKLDRLSRSVVDTVKLILEEWDGRCYLKSAKEMVDTTSPMGRQFFYLLVSYAEWERNIIRERTFAGKLQRAREGKNPGYSAPFGYRAGSDGRFEVIPGQAETVRMLFRLYLEQRSISALTRIMNASGIPAPRGRGWGRSTIHRLLQNPAYSGRLVYGRQAMNPRRGKGPGEPRRLRRSEPLVVHEAVIPPIIDCQTFAAAQRALRARDPRRTPGRSLASQPLLTGLAACLHCGHRITGYTRGPGKPRYYRCAGQSEKGAALCPAGFVVQHDADRHISGHLLRLYTGPDSTARVQSRVQERLSTQLREARAARQEIIRRRAELLGQMERIDRDYLAQRLSADRYQQLRAGLERSLGEADRQMARWSRHLQDGRAGGARQQDLLRSLGGADRWSCLSRAEQKALLRELVAGVALYKDRGSGAICIEVTWKVAAPA